MQECLPLSRIHGTPWQIALFTGFLGNVAYERGEYESSYRLLSEALERSQVIGDPRLIGYHFCISRSDSPEVEADCGD